MKPKSGSVFHKSPELLPLKSEKCFPLFVDFRLLCTIKEKHFKGRGKKEIKKGRVASDIAFAIKFNGNLLSKFSTELRRMKWVVKFYPYFYILILE